MKTRYGNMNRVRLMVKASFSGSAMNPGAITRTITGAAMMPKMVIALKTIMDQTKRVLANSQKVFMSSFSLYSDKTGTTAAFMAPSPTKSRNKLGILEATKKASARNPVPSSLATMTSLTKPRIRELKVPSERIDVDLIRERWESLWSNLLIDTDTLICYICA